MRHDKNSALGLKYSWRSSPIQRTLLSHRKIKLQLVPKTFTCGPTSETQPTIYFQNKQIWRWNQQQSEVWQSSWSKSCDRTVSLEKTHSVMWRTRAVGVARGGGGGSVSRVLTRVGRPRHSRHPSCTFVFVTMSSVIPQLDNT